MVPSSHLTVAAPALKAGMWGEAGGAHWLEQDSASQASIRVPVLSQTELRVKDPVFVGTTQG